MSVITLASTQVGAGDIIEDLRQRIGRRWASVSKMARARDVRPHTVKYGVRVLFNKTDPSRVRFTFITEDYCVVDAVFEFEFLSQKGRDYLEQWVLMIDEAINSKRAERLGHAKPMLVRNDPMIDHIRKEIGARGGDPDPIIEQANRWASELVGEEKLA